MLCYKEFNVVSKILLKLVTDQVFYLVNLRKPITTAIFSNKLRRFDLNLCFQNVKVVPLTVNGVYFVPHPKSMCNVCEFTFAYCCKNVWSSCLFAVWRA